MQTKRRDKRKAFHDVLDNGLDNLTPEQYTGEIVVVFQASRGGMSSWKWTLTVSGEGKPIQKKPNFDL